MDTNKGTETDTTTGADLAEHRKRAAHNRPIRPTHTRRGPPPPGDNSWKTTGTSPRGTAKRHTTHDPTDKPDPDRNVRSSTGTPPPLHPDVFVPHITCSLLCSRDAWHVPTRLVFRHHTVFVHLRGCA